MVRPHWSATLPMGKSYENVAKVGCAFPMVVFILLLVELGQNDHREDASNFDCGKTPDLVMCDPLYCLIDYYWTIYQFFV